ncbi:MAG: anthranilate phosphoribosyltransferase [Pseudomonadota bacterium]
MTEPMTAFLKQVFSGQRLTSSDAERAFDLLLSGKASPVETAGFLGALASRGETVDEILGAVRIMRQKSVPVDAPDNVIDCCGTGGDSSGSFNISTAVAFVVAGCGVPVAKHGNRAASSKSGAADVLEALGLNLYAGPMAVRKALWNENICFLMAPQYNPAAKYVAPVRKELRARTIFNLLGPLLNPAGAKRQLIGVYDKKLCTPLAETLKQLGCVHAWIVHGKDGLDELTTTTSTAITELKDGKIRSFEVHPHDLDIGVYKKSDLLGGSATENAAAICALLDGKRGAYRDIVILNAAAALIVSGTVQNLSQGADMARQSLDTGKAKQALDRLVEIYKG